MVPTCSFAQNAKTKKTISYDPKASCTIITGDELTDKALATAIWTIDHNTTEDSLLKAGADYGGEWTRDIAINSWNAVSLLRPGLAEHSLWSVTEERKTIGHQYWDKIIWTIAAWNHYLITGNESFLAQAYDCCKRTMQTLEDTCFDHSYGLFMGPAVYQDGITAYEEPVFDTTLKFNGFVLAHPNSHTIKCLSTNAVYFYSYLCLAEMAKLREPAAVKGYLQKAQALKRQFRKHFLNKKEGKLYFLIDHTGHKHDFQEGLGVAFAIKFGLVSESEALAILKNIHSTPSGIPATWPCLKRCSAEQPGRHNVMIWPHVNMFFADACASAGRYDLFRFEVSNLAQLAVTHDPNGEVNFHEIYTPDGIPSGGWQCGSLWPPLNHQTWCATGFLRNYLYHILGLAPTPEGLYLYPLGASTGKVSATNLPYRDALLNITVYGVGTQIAECTINGEKSRPFIPANATGTIEVVIRMK